MKFGFSNLFGQQVKQAQSSLVHAPRTHWRSILEGQNECIVITFEPINVLNKKTFGVNNGFQRREEKRFQIDEGIKRRYKGITMATIIIHSIAQTK